jgi:hypothetical protein
MTTPKSRILILLSLMAALVSIPAWVSASDAGFTAQFQWQDHLLQIRVAPGMKNARILSQGKVLANCATKAEAPMTETGRAIASLAPSQIDLECEATEFGAMTGPATLIFKGPGVETPVIRFGTWLDGYRQADLLVSTDRISHNVQRKPAGKQTPEGV